MTYPFKQNSCELPEPPQKGGIYTQVRFFGNGLAYVSGMGPNTEGKEPYFGKMGAAYDLDQGREAARDAALNLLAVLKRDLGDLAKVKRVAKILCFIACEDDFYMQPQVADAASEVLMQYLGETAGCAARSAIGVNVLPGNIPFEIEALLEIEE